MKDPAHYNVQILKLQRELEELLAYMAPTPGQRAQILSVSFNIAHCALQIHKYHEENKCPG